MPYSTQQIRNGPSRATRRRQNNLVRSPAACRRRPAGGRPSSAAAPCPISTHRETARALHHAAIASTDHAGIHVNLIDLPGYPDFRGPALSALGAVDTAAIVVDAAGGVEYGTQRMMQRARERGLCRAIVVNRIDAEGADCARALDELREAFGPEVLPLNLPADGARVVDCFGQSSGDSDLGPVADWHQKILDRWSR